MFTTRSLLFFPSFSSPSTYDFSLLRLLLIIHLLIYLQIQIPDFKWNPISELLLSYGLIYRKRMLIQFIDLDFVCATLLDPAPFWLIARPDHMIFLLYFCNLELLISVFIELYLGFFLFVSMCVASMEVIPLDLEPGSYYHNTQSLSKVMLSVWPGFTLYDWLKWKFSFSVNWWCRMFPCISN